jgi:hypothetical protein
MGNTDEKHRLRAGRDQCWHMGCLVLSGARTRSTGVQDADKHKTSHFP